MVDNGQSERQAPRGWFWAVGNERDPAGLLGKERVPGEERAGVSVWADAEEDEVEDGEACSVLVGELADEL